MPCSDHQAHCSNGGQDTLTETHTSEDTAVVMEPCMAPDTGAGTVADMQLPIMATQIVAHL